MTADAARVRRARVAIYGPLAAGALGVILVAGGTVGFSVIRDVGTAQLHAPPPVSPSPLAPSAPSTRGAYILVGADAQLYAFGDLAHPRLATANPADKAPAAAPRQSIVAATSAAADGLWLATADGQVYASRTPVPGHTPLAKGAARIVGIAPTAEGRGYRLVASDGHVYAFGTPNRAQPRLTTHAASVIGIAPAANDGYWLAHRDGSVTPVGAPALGGVKLRAHAAPVVAIAAGPGGKGYWLVTRDGHVHAFGVPFAGDLTGTHGKVDVVGIAPSGTDGYWITTADGTVYPFGAPTFPGAPGVEPRAPIVAILPY